MSPRRQSAAGWPAPATTVPRRCERDPPRGTRPSSRRRRNDRSRNSSGTGRRRMASAAKSGPPPVSPASSRRNAVSTTTGATSAGCSRSCTGRPNSRSNGPSSGTRRPSGAGATRSGPELRRRAHRERRALVFEDESGFYLLPGVVKTYAPEGLTPVLREKQTRDHLSVMGGMTPEGRVYTLIRQESLNGLQCIEFLLHLRRVAGERLLVIWDGSPIHRRVEVRGVVARRGGRVWLEALPGYAPDLNPWDEGGWHYLKDVEMRNLVCRDLEELHQELDLAVGRLRQKPHLVRSFFAQAGLKRQET